MTDKPISPLRWRMIEDMTVRGFTACMRRGYLRAVEDFTVRLHLCLNPGHAGRYAPIPQTKNAAARRGADLTAVPLCAGGEAILQD